MSEFPIDTVDARWCVIIELRRSSRDEVDEERSAYVDEYEEVEG